MQHVLRFCILATLLLAACTMVEGSRGYIPEMPSLVYDPFYHSCMVNGEKEMCATRLKRDDAAIMKSLKDFCLAAGGSPQYCLPYILPKGFGVIVPATLPILGFRYCTREQNEPT